MRQGDGETGRQGDGETGSCCCCCLELTSVGVWTLQTFSFQHVDLSDQLRVTTHPRPAGLRRLVQSQLSAETDRQSEPEPDLDPDPDLEPKP